MHNLRARKWVLFPTLAFFVFFCVNFSLADTTTPNLGLDEPSHGELNWDVQIDSDLSMLDTAISAKAAAIPGLSSNGNYGVNVQGAISAGAMLINPLAAAPASPVDQAVYVANRVTWNPSTLPAITYSASTIAFVSGSPATITDSASGFVTAGFLPGQFVYAYDNTALAAVGTYQIASVAAGTLTLISGQTLTAQAAGHSITLTGGAPYFATYSANGASGSAEYIAGCDTLGNCYSSNGALGPSSSTANDVACFNDTGGKQLKDCGAMGKGVPEQIVAVFNGGSSPIATSILPYYAHRDYAYASINKWTVTCNNGGSDTTPIIVSIGGKVTTASTSGALPTIASNGFCGSSSSGYYPTGNSSTQIAQGTWNANCSVQSTSANTDFIFSVTQGPSASTWCSVIVEVTR
jgi:hypothetical protein